MTIHEIGKLLRIQESFLVGFDESTVMQRTRHMVLMMIHGPMSSLLVISKFNRLFQQLLFAEFSQIIYLLKDIFIVTAPC